MNWESEFSDKWQDFLKTVKSAILLELKKKKNADASALNNVIKLETLSWLNPNVSKGVYLQTLSKKDTQSGKRFEQVLNELHCKEGISIKSISSLTVTSLMFGVAILIFGLLYWAFSSDTRISVGIAALYMLVVTPLGLQRADKWNQKNRSLKVDEIIQDLDKQGNELRKIVTEIE